ncbi:NAD(P)-binding protein [Lentinus tigrinus ALCF2SS1-7]|uniref:D-xylose 1-dehydrogenase (NADP(+), D-xylono-1,5-lactone-forming) n=1 Tax=Lentinus tigrinus ALCF2SS1-6 TaxID=1328759 RepID=A0A5C2SAB1_9APHY|nr:NAD(P)-binding protein [Lentinus tigrinus ALCF2SS1-6]RPD74803.1 NAD(P)-binding protein [Lentinus tigrinus ALCF2SS1-7]
MCFRNRPPPPDLSTSALRFGILGAARIAPTALITPAKTHPDVVVAAIACRGKGRGEAFAQKHNIPKTFTGPTAYQDLIADPDIDAIYIALPNGLHFEWAMRALQANKHVLVEKPMTNTAAEAQQLFALASKRGLVALEAIHCTFHPALHRAREIVDSGELGHVKSVAGTFTLPSLLSPFFFHSDDPRFRYDLGGGCMMDMGVYPLAALRFITASDTAPLAVTSATATGHALDATRVDRGMHATYTLPLPPTWNPEAATKADVTAEMTVDFATPGWGPFGLLPRSIKNEITVYLEGGEVFVYNFVSPGMFHYIKVRPKCGRTRYEQAYRFRNGWGKRSWDSYRYQLEAFVDKVRGHSPALWPEPVTVITQLKIIEDVYVKAGMPPRCASSYKARDA